MPFTHRGKMKIKRLRIALELTETLLLRRRTQTCRSVDVGQPRNNSVSEETDKANVLSVTTAKEEKNETKE